MSSQPLQRDASQPLHRQLAAELRTQIERGTLSEGTKLPPERTLCDAYGVSRITVRHAISQLEQEGLVTRVQGLGTFVSASKYEQPLAEVHSFEHAMNRFGYTAGTRIHHVGTVAGDLLLSNTLQLDSSSSIANLQIIGIGNDTPIVFYDSYFSQAVGEKIITAAQRRAEAHRSFSTLDLYQDIPGLQPVEAEQTFEATVSDVEVSALLEIPLGSPILRVTSILSSASGALEYRRAAYRGDKYKFVIQRDLRTEPIL